MTAHADISHSPHSVQQAGSSGQDPLWLDWLPAPLREKLAGRTNLLDIFQNTGWLFFDRIYRMGVGMVLGIWVARYLAPVQFGMMNYAISFTAIVGAFAALGFDSILVRELVRRRDRTAELLGTALLLRIIAGAAVILLSVLAAALLEQGQPLMRLLIIVLSVGYLLQAFDVFDYYFQSHVRSKFSVIARNIAFTLTALLKVWFLLTKGPLLAFVVLVPVEFFLGSIGLWIMFRRKGEAVRFRFDGNLARALLRDGWPLALSSIAIIIYMRINQVMLGRMIGAASVGIYAAAVRLVEVWYFIPSAVTVSVFPAIVKAKAENEQVYRRRLQQLYDLMAWISLTFAIGISLTSGWIMHILYGGAYDVGAPVLTIYAWSGVATFLGVASSQFLTAENLTRISLYRTLIGMVLNIALNLMFIPPMGIVGSAIATLISYIAATFSIALFRPGRLQGKMMLKALVPIHAFSSGGRRGE